MNQSVDKYFIEGCGRCELAASPQCKVHRWTQELSLLRAILGGFELKEECKWGVPCYTLNKKNVIILSAFKDYCFLSFFKGSLMKDDAGLLEKAGPNSEIARLLKFRSVEEVQLRESYIRDFICQAIDLENSGAKVEIQKKVEEIPEELEAFFKSDPELEFAFKALSPGRQRGYIIYFSQPKQSKTRQSRIEKSVNMIKEGIGLHDKYQSKK